jgi:hypothetical protein
LSPKLLFPFHILVSENAKNMNAAELAGGGVYNLTRVFNTKYHYCKPGVGVNSHHAYSNALVVDIDKLMAEIEW